MRFFIRTAVFMDCSAEKGREGERGRRRRRARDPTEQGWVQLQRGCGSYPQSKLSLHAGSFLCQPLCYARLYIDVLRPRVALQELAPGVA